MGHQQNLTVGARSIPPPQHAYPPGAAICLPCRACCSGLDTAIAPNLQETPHQNPSTPAAGFQSAQTYSHPQQRRGSELARLWWWPLGPPSFGHRHVLRDGARSASLRNYRDFDPTLRKLRRGVGSPGRGPPLAPEKQTSTSAPSLTTPAASPGRSGLPADGHTWASVASPSDSGKLAPLYVPVLMDQLIPASPASVAA